MPWLRIPSLERLRLIFCLALSLCGTSQALAGISVIDDRDREINLAKPATRIIALYGAFNEILADLGQEHRIVARTAADPPLSIVDRPSIGTHLRPNAELILALEPDLVLQLGGREEAMDTVRFLEERGLTVAVFNLDGFDRLFSTMDRLGVLTATAEQTRSRVQSMKSELQRLDSAQSGPRPTVFFEARYPNLLAAGQKSMVTEIITRAGGSNCVTSDDKLVRLGEEEILRLDPDIYLIQHGPMNPSPQPLAERPLFRTLRCLRTNQAFVVEQGLFSRPGPRSLDAVRQLQGIITTWKTENAQ